VGFIFWWRSFEDMELEKFEKDMAHIQHMYRLKKWHSPKSSEVLKNVRHKYYECFNGEGQVPLHNNFVK
jgi:hypothetical protein